ncbi:hypothetical protein C6345_09485 [Bacillus sp. LNXM12-2]|uniref:restriction endonuclease subunit S n=1 Tax=unclassified Bacillus (in: firmicutes) TaxID=185979 RepID=UPI000D073F16|nr:MULTISPECIES: restriction endonuclease subunit S [unclassified Bacillus (in: firmicutes)]PSB73437.1 hypothetical protein C6345_09485 [Bacillus sp. LNXM12-2]
MSDKITKLPQIRFEEFTDAWEQRKLKELFVKGGSGGTPRSTNKDYYKGEIPFLGISDISNSNGYIYYTQKHISEEGLNNSSAWIVPKGAITLAMYASVGKVAILNVDVATSQAFYNMVFNDKTIRDFIYQRLVKANINEEWRELISTGTQSNLNAEKVKNFQIQLPKNKGEQSKIGKIFNQLDNIITLNQRKYDKLVIMKKSMLEKMFPKDGANFPEIRFAGFTDPWEQRKYGEVIDLLSGQDFAPSEYNDTGNGIPYMTGASCIVGKETIVNRWTTVPRCLAEKGDVLLVCKGSGYGAIAVMTQDKAHIARQFMALKNLPNLDKVFNFYLLNSVIENIKKDARGLIAGIARDAVIKQEISIPLLAEQQKIGSFFNQLDNLITLHRRELNLIKNLKKSLLQQMFI